jgi:hypothetical protein
MLYRDLTSEQRVDVEFAARELLIWFNTIDKEFFTDDASPLQRDGTWSAVMNGGSGVLALATLSQAVAPDCSRVGPIELSARERSLASLDSLAQERLCQAFRSIRYYWRGFTEGGLLREGAENWYYGMEPYTVFANLAQRVVGFDQLWREFGRFHQSAVDVQRELHYSIHPFWDATAGAVSHLGIFNIVGSQPHVVPASFPFLYLNRIDDRANAHLFAPRILEQQIMNETIASTPIGAAWAQHAADWSRVFSILAMPQIEFGRPQVRSSVISKSHDGALDIVKLTAPVPSGDWVMMQGGGAVVEHSPGGRPWRFELRIGSDQWLTSTDKSPENPGMLARLAGVQEGISKDDAAPYTTATWDLHSESSANGFSGQRAAVLTRRHHATSLDLIDVYNFDENTQRSLVKESLVWRVLSCAPTADAPQFSRKTALIDGQKHPVVLLSRGERGGNMRSLELHVLQPIAAEVRLSPLKTSGSSSTCYQIEVEAPRRASTRADQGRGRLNFLIRAQLSR